MELLEGLFLSLVYWISVVAAQDLDSSRTGLTSFDQLDRTVVDSVYKIVDDKFDSLSERISSLERAVNGLQYYNVRQFKVVTTNLNSVNKILQALNSQVGNTGNSDSGFKNEVTELKQEIKSLQTSNNLMFEAMEQNFNYLNKGFSDRMESLETKVSAMSNSSDEITQKIRDSIVAQPLQYAPDTSQPNCSLIVEQLENKVDIVLNNTINSLKMTQQSTENQVSSTVMLALTRNLASLNENVKRTMAYYHHTGDLVERIVGATETVAEDQTIIRDDLREFLEKQINITSCHGRQNVPPFDEKLVNGHRTKEPSDLVSKCEIPVQAMTDFKHVLQNGTHLVEIVTALAETSQKSLKTTVVELLKEVYRLKDVKKTEAKSTDPPAVNGFIEYDFELLLNATKGVLQMIEAVASHTRWIPYIFHNLQFVEGQINRTLTQSSTLLNSLDIFDKHRLPTGENSNMTSLIGYIYQTSAKLNRLTPSLTRLLGEPEPFIVLNGGKLENEGRVEIYKKGKWGTLCGRFGHIEAAYICRHLGYMGGNSAGSGYFGPGTGVFWSVNVSCLYTRQCDIVKPVIHDSHCDHNDDFAVVCDHMIRLIPDDDVASRDTGFLEIHHMEHWTRICSDQWTDENSNVACKQMGFTKGVLSSPSGIYEPPNERLHAVLNNVNCTGNEIRLDACSHGNWSPSTCPSKEFVHLTCS